MSCKYCTATGLVPEELEIVSNADTSWDVALIAQGNRQKEIILSIRGTAYGIEINYCPICGERLHDE